MVLANRILRIIKTGMLAAAGIVIICAVICFFLDLKPVVVMSGSMEPEIAAGALAFIDTEEKDVKKGSIAAFEIEDQMITHRIVRKTSEGFVTKGDANSSIDPWRIDESQIRGTTKFSIPGIGYAVKDVTGKRGIIIIITVCAVIIGAEALTGRRT